MAESPALEWSEEAQRALRNAGHRAGGARSAVVELLAGQSCCLSAQEISEGLQAQGTDVGLASVYRALDLLHEMHLVQRVEIGELRRVVAAYTQRLEAHVAQQTRELQAALPPELGARWREATALFLLPFLFTSLFLLSSAHLLADIGRAVGIGRWFGW